MEVLKNGKVRGTLRATPRSVSELGQPSGRAWGRDG
jgi:hypothetical protein